MAERVMSNPARMAENWRIAMSALVNQHLALHQILRMPNALSPTDLIIYLTVVAANVQRLMRERNVPTGYAAMAVLPREWVIPISRHAIAAATGLPRETVRRRVARMIEDGVLVEDARGGVTPPAGMIREQGVEPMLEAMLTEFNRTAEALLRIGVIETRRD